jgi:type IV pilus assembly protein PilE
MKNKGFTLIELLVVLSIVAMLLAYALPNYRQYVMESKRAAAHNRLLEIAGMYEKFYANTNAYPTSLTGTGVTELGLDSGYLVMDDYTVTAANNANGWTLTATATGGQAEDSECPTITLNNLGTRGPTVSCWE